MNHIGTETDEAHAWCGATLDTSFYFKNAELAALNGAHTEIPKAVCSACLDRVVECLQRGRVNEE